MISGLRLLFSKSSRHENIDFDRQYRAAREAGPLQAGFNDKHSVFAAKAMEEVQLNVRASFNCPMQFSRTIQQLLSNTSISVEKSRQLLSIASKGLEYAPFAPTPQLTQFLMDHIQQACSKPTALQKIPEMSGLAAALVTNVVQKGDHESPATSKQAATEIVYPIIARARLVTSQDEAQSLWTVANAALTALSKACPIDCRAEVFDMILKHLIELIYAGDDPPSGQLILMRRCLIALAEDLSTYCAKHVALIGSVTSNGKAPWKTRVEAALTVTYVAQHAQYFTKQGLWEPEVLNAMKKAMKRARWNYNGTVRKAAQRALEAIKIMRFEPVGTSPFDESDSECENCETPTVAQMALWQEAVIKETSEVCNRKIWTELSLNMMTF